MNDYITRKELAEILLDIAYAMEVGDHLIVRELAEEIRALEESDD